VDDGTAAQIGGGSGALASSDAGTLDTDDGTTGDMSSASAQWDCEAAAPAAATAAQPSLTDRVGAGAGNAKGVCGWFADEDGARLRAERTACAEAGASEADELDDGDDRPSEPAVLTRGDKVLLAVAAGVAAVG